MTKNKIYTFLIVLTVIGSSSAIADCKAKSKEIAKKAMERCLQQTQCSIFDLFDKKCSKKMKNLKKECLLSANAEAESYLRKCTE